MQEQLIGSVFDFQSLTNLLRSKEYLKSFKDSALCKVDKDEFRVLSKTWADSPEALLKRVKELDIYNRWLDEYEIEEDGCHRYRLW